MLYRYGNEQRAVTLETDKRTGLVRAVAWTTVTKAYLMHCYAATYFTSVSFHGLIKFRKQPLQFP